MPVIELQDTRFKQIGEGMLDNRKRLGLTRVLELLRERYGDRGLEKLCFTIHSNSAGEILLVPETTIPLNEAWLHRNPVALKSVLTGIQQAEHGQLKNLGSFGQYAETDLDE